MCEAGKTGTMYGCTRLGFLSGMFLATFLLISAAASSVELVASRDTLFCERVVELFQKNMEERRRFNLHKEPFSPITWEPVSLAGLGPKTRYCSSLDKAIVDLDNDGHLDLVVKTTFCMKGAPSDSLYVFPADSAVLDQATWQDLSPLLATPDKFERTGGTYPLSSLRIENVAVSPALTTLFAIQPFILDDVTSVSLTDARHEWIVVAKYLRGGRFEDQCYLRVPSS